MLLGTDRSLSVLIRWPTHIWSAPKMRMGHFIRPLHLFATDEKPTLRPLPPERFVPGTWARHKVPPDYHLALDGGVYSVPHTLIGKTVGVHSTAGVISVFLRGKRMIVSTGNWTVGSLNGRTPGRI